MFTEWRLPPASADGCALRLLRPTLSLDPNRLRLSMIEVRQPKTGQFRPIGKQGCGPLHGREAVEPDFNTMAHQFKAIYRHLWPPDACRHRGRIALNNAQPLPSWINRVMAALIITHSSESKASTTSRCFRLKLADAAATAYNAMLAEDLQELKSLYKSSLTKALRLIPWGFFRSTLQWAITPEIGVHSKLSSFSTAARFCSMTASILAPHAVKSGNLSPNLARFIT